MICLYCKKPILKYPAFTQYDPQWVHEFEGMPWGSEYCEGSNPYERTANTVATPGPAEAKHIPQAEIVIEPPTRLGRLA
jgi:hypothetical protein